MSKSGSCLCGAVSFVINGELRPPVACHCSQCRKMSGHLFAATQVDDAALKMTSGETLTWFRSSENAERGFCNRCGSSLFWRMDGEGRTSVACGALDEPTGLSGLKDIFTSDHGDYYEEQQQIAVAICQHLLRPR